ncbi:hypothetical protein PFISCL1PPCAC_28783 [Pristionchus fissidentatus]|uniref:Peptidase C1A papain C-terminal domain-containing protein n=1 Tax=Pristionchus fissidentatus TaxID=1538716 RepID=A0AAV5WYK9_9BILA|nr:hypothetical protein PFISCL1PPCAC_28783 [Pristionchus fissidentatus]
MILHVLLIFLTQCILQLQTRPSLPLGQRVYENDCSVPAFREYQKDFGKSLDQFDEERRNRLCTLIDAKKVHNSGASGFKMGVNGLSDLSTDEYRRRQGFAYASKKSSGKEPLPVQQSSSAQQSLPLPESIDWRKKGFTSAVKDQGNCGSSWAFAAAGAIEFAKFKKTGKVTKISEQNLIDCSKSSGCSSGNPGLAMKFIVENGVDTDKTNPYKAKEDLCTYRETKGEEKISDFEYLQREARRLSRLRLPILARLLSE